MTLLTNRRKAEQSNTMWRLTSTTLNNQPAKEKKQKQTNKQTLKTNENRITDTSRSIGCYKSSSLGEIYSNK